MENTNTQEFWKAVPNYEGYEVSNKGAVRSLDRRISYDSGNRRIKGKTLTTRRNNCGYIEVRLYRNGIAKTTFVHIILAKAFIPNLENKPYVNHKNGNKADNSLENLEWCTHSENMKHAYRLGLCKKTQKEIPVIDICTNQTFSSLRKAADYYSIPYSTCKGYLNGNRKNLSCLRILKSDAA